MSDQREKPSGRAQAAARELLEDLPLFAGAYYSSVVEDLARAFDAFAAGPAPAPATYHPTAVAVTLTGMIREHLEHCLRTIKGADCPDLLHIVDEWARKISKEPAAAPAGAQEPQPIRVTSGSVVGESLYNPKTVALQNAVNAAWWLVIRKVEGEDADLWREEYQHLVTNIDGPLTPKSYAASEPEAGAQGEGPREEPVRCQPHGKIGCGTCALDAVARAAQPSGEEPISTSDGALARMEHDGWRLPVREIRRLRSDLEHEHAKYLSACNSVQRNADRVREQFERANAAEAESVRQRERAEQALAREKVLREGLELANKLGAAPLVPFGVWTSSLLARAAAAGAEGPEKGEESSR